MLGDKTNELFSRIKGRAFWHVELHLSIGFDVFQMKENETLTKRRLQVRTNFVALCTMLDIATNRVNMQDVFNADHETHYETQCHLLHTMAHNVTPFKPWPRTGIVPPPPPPRDEEAMQLPGGSELVSHIMEKRRQRASNVALEGRERDTACTQACGGKSAMRVVLSLLHHPSWSTASDVFE
jgi:hypothetical protein